MTSRETGEYGSIEHWRRQPVQLINCVRATSPDTHHTPLPTGISLDHLIHAVIAPALLAAVLMGTPVTVGWARGDNASTTSDLMDLTLEQLMDLQVTSVSKQPERLGAAAAAVFVITNEDIRRSGAQTIPELLRMVPGLQVGEVDHNRWAVSARGFNSVFANKLLVLVDGRSVYTPSFSGVYWDGQAVPLYDIERIEVVRGPGATLWGVNAVNGIINVITKSANATQGLHVESIGGSGELDHYEGVRYGGQLGESKFVRVYGSLRGTGTSGNLKSGSGNNHSGAGSFPLPKSRDDASMGRLGFRADAVLSECDGLTVQGEIMDGSVGSTYTLAEVNPPYQHLEFTNTDVSSANVLTRFTHRFGSSANEMQVQFYYDRATRRDVSYGESDNTFDINLQQSLQLGPWCKVLSGAEYRYVDLRFTETEYLSGGSEPHRTLRCFSGFSQADLDVLENRLAITAGAKLEETEYADAEFQPSVRVRMNVAPHHSIWASLSRAARTPSGVEADAAIRVYTIPPFSLNNESPIAIVAEVRGSEEFRSETVASWEAGYRALLSQAWSIDIAAFWNDYNNLLSTVPVELEMVSATLAVQPLPFGNALNATTSGIEVASDWCPIHDVRLNAAYTYLDMSLTTDNLEYAEIDRGHLAAYGRVPRHQLSARAQINARHNVDCDLWLRAVDELSTLGIDGYTELDLRLEWRPIRQIAIAGVGRNLLHDEHNEFLSDLSGLSSGITRSGYLAIRLDF